MKSVWLVLRLRTGPRGLQFFSVTALLPRRWIVQCMRLLAYSVMPGARSATGNSTCGNI